jgi:hypothetical protein
LQKSTIIQLFRHTRTLERANHFTNGRHVPFLITPHAYQQCVTLPSNMEPKAMLVLFFHVQKRLFHEIQVSLHNLRTSQHLSVVSTCPVTIPQRSLRTDCYGDKECTKNKKNTCHKLTECTLLVFSSFKNFIMPLILFFQFGVKFTHYFKMSKIVIIGTWMDAVSEIGTSIATFYCYYYY